MNIIIIGPDGSGKTTFAKNLAKEFNMNYVKCSYLENNKLTRAKEMLENNKNTVYDRFYFPDEMVYSKVKGSNITIPEKWAWEKIENMLTDTIIIYFYAEYTELVSRLINRGDEYVSVSEISSILETYDEILKDINVPIVKVKSHKDYSITIEGVM